jgi:hypothetical protein
MRGRDLRAPVKLVGGDRVVHLIRARQAVVADRAALLAGAVDEGGGQRRRRGAHVACHGVLAGAEIRHERASELVKQVLGDFGGIKAAHVVGFEDGRIDHGLKGLRA